MDNFKMSDFISALDIENWTFDKKRKKEEDIEDCTELVNILKDLMGKHKVFSPVVKKGVESLKEIQIEHHNLKANYIKEKAILKDKYQKLYEPLYTKRYDIVKVMVEAVRVLTTYKESDNADEEKGVPNFWLTVLKNHYMTFKEVYDGDEEALKYLKDIKRTKIDNRKGFKLEFIFDTNPYFKNSVLTKTYHTIDVDVDVVAKLPILEKAIGTDINWYEGKCLTQTYESFFNFFSPPQLPSDDEVLDKDEMEDRVSFIEDDYIVGSSIEADIIPNAMSWFTGKGKNKYVDMEVNDYYTYDYYYYSDDDDDMENDEEEEEEEEDATRKKHGRVVPAGEGGDAQQGEGGLLSASNNEKNSDVTFMDENTD